MQDEGEVRLFGTTHHDNGSQIRRQLGVVFQARSIDLDMTIRANLRFHGRLFGLGGRALENMIDELSEQVGLGALTGSLVRQLSGGQQRKVEIARALLNKPELLIMDEASAGLDVTSRRALVSDIQSLSQDHAVAVLWATHLVEEVEGADEIVLLNNGKVVAASAPADLIAKADARTLEETYTQLTGEG